jgi:hypothetical protein
MIDTPSLVGHLVAHPARLVSVARRDSWWAMPPAFTLGGTPPPSGMDGMPSVVLADRLRVRSMSGSVEEITKLKNRR